MKNDTTEMAKEATKIAVEQGVEIAKDGISSIVNGLIMKVVFVVTFVIIALTAGCVGSNVMIDKLTSHDHISK